MTDPSNSLPNSDPVNLANVYSKPDGSLLSDSGGVLEGRSVVPKKDPTENSADVHSNHLTENVSKKIFIDYPTLDKPKVKWRGFNTNNIKVADIFFVKYFIYGYQILKKWKDDKYSGLRFAVCNYNREKTEKNIDGVINQLKLLKANESADFNDDTLMKLADEVAIYKFKMLANSPESITFISGAAKSLTPIKEAPEELNRLILNYNDETKIKTKEQFIQILDQLFLWMETSKAQKKHPEQVKNLLSELSTGVQDTQLYELFNLLKTDKTLNSHQKIEALADRARLDDGRALKLCQGKVLSIPQINVKFSRSSELTALKKAIAEFNKHQTPQNFIHVVAALQDWQHLHSEAFNSSNALKIVGDMTEILDGVSKQDKIKKLDAYVFIESNREKIIKSKDIQWNSVNWDFSTWKVLPLPKNRKHLGVKAEKNKEGTSSSVIGELSSIIKDFNRSKKNISGLSMTLKLQGINDKLLKWAEKHPEEFMTCGGELIMTALQKNILKSVVKQGPRITAEISNELGSVNSVIIEYNKNPTIGALHLVKLHIEEWKNKQADTTDEKNEVLSGEFSRYHGPEMLKELTEYFKSIENFNNVNLPLPTTLLLPNSHPSAVFDQSMTLGPPQANGKRAYLMIFHNPIAPWSHTEIGIVTGPSSLTKASFLSSNKPPDPKIFNGYIENGVLIKHFSQDQFPNNRQYVHDVINHVILNKQVLTQKSFASEQFEGISSEDFSFMVFNFLQKFQFIDANGHVAEKYFNPPEGLRSTDWDFHENEEINTQMCEYIQTIISPLLHPEEFSKQIEISKSKEAFEFLKDGKYLKEDGLVDPAFLHRNSKLWDAISDYYQDDKDYGNYLIAVLACPISRPFNEASFVRGPISNEESEALFSFLTSNNLLDTKTNSKEEKYLFLKEGWELIVKSSEDNRAKFIALPHREGFLQQLATFGTVGETTQRKYLGIGAEHEGLDQVSMDAEGVRLVDSRLVDRVEKLCKRRKNEIQKNMNVFAGIRGGVRALFKGGYATLMHTKETKVRHLRQAFIDNFLTSIDPQAFLPNLKESRYRLEVYESGGQIYRKWIEDPNGKFGQTKNVSQLSQNHSGEYIEGDYHKNSYVLGEDGRLKSVKSLDKEKLETHERGNIVQKADGTQEWMVDEEFGQCFKPKGTKKEDLKDVEKDDRTLYSAMNCEKYLANGESEWCGSYAIRMLQSAYAYEYMPEFKPLLESLNKDFRESSSYDEKDKEHSQFEKRHASILFTLADRYAKKIIDEDIGRKYFRDMHPAVRLNSRSTPDQIHEFLVGKDPGLLNSASRAAKTLQMPTMRNEKGKNRSISLIAGMAIGTGLTAVLGAPTAVLKLAFNVTTATMHAFTTDIAKAAHQSYQHKTEEFDRRKEAGQKIKHRKLKLFKAVAFNGLLIGGLGRRIGMQYLGGQEIIDTAKKTKNWATTSFIKTFKYGKPNTQEVSAFA
ncbi:MAG: hypothetical protein H0X29_03240 [Parachlamydiaceae bacterium]|nr:hypothetical protein [Parachlamydiaceae bacterium]